MKIIMAFPMVGTSYYLAQDPTDFKCVWFEVNPDLSLQANAQALHEAIQEALTTIESKDLVVLVSFSPQFAKYLDDHGVVVHMLSVDEQHKYLYFSQRQGATQAQRDLLDANWTKYHTYLHNAAYGARHLIVHHLSNDQYLSDWMRNVKTLEDTDWVTSPKFRVLDRPIPKGK